ncbi:MAG TPA: ABC transporter permease, partial [Brevibacterium sp.]|nr:ABC transporter permease [Brevibacterium sp.]
MSEFAPAGDPVIPDYGQASDCVINNGAFCTDWFISQWSTVFWPPLLSHIVMVAIAVSIGFVIAFFAALLAYRKKWLAGPISMTATFLYTLPPLALFQLLVPFTGLSLLTVEIALVCFTLVIIFQGVLSGLAAVPDDV